jgi:hypothetical protein
MSRENAIASEHGNVAGPGSGAFLTPGSGMGESSGSGSGMNNPDPISESLETIFGDLGWKKYGFGINIPDPQH